MTNHEELEEEKCLGCSLVDEFKELIEDDVNWEEALRYVLHVALDIKEEELITVSSDAYSDGFEDGLKLGVEKSAKLLNDLVDYTDEQIADYRAEREAELNGETEEESEEIEDISDEDFDKIAKLIRESKGRN